MTTRRDWIIALGALGLLTQRQLLAQPQFTKVYRIGFLSSESASGYKSRADAFRAGLRELGYVEGKNVAIEYRWAGGQYGRLPELAAELVGLKVDVIVTHANPGGAAAKKATATIPIVIASTGDPVATGLVSSLSRPGGNITGSMIFGPELGAKRLELIAEALPRITNVAFLFRRNDPANPSNLHALETAAKSLKIGLQKFDVAGPSEFAGAFSAMAAARVDAVVIHQNAMLNDNIATIAKLAAQARLPSAGYTEFAAAGGMIGYGANSHDLFRRAAYFVDRIFKGANPGDLPIERATKFELIINLKTAKALGVTIPQSILLRADKVIE